MHPFYNFSLIFVFEALEANMCPFLKIGYNQLAAQQMAMVGMLEGYLVKGMIYL